MFYVFLKDEVTLYIILTNTLGCQSKIEVEFSSNDRVITRIPGIQENEYTVSVASPGKHETVNHILC